MTRHGLLLAAITISLIVASLGPCLAVYPIPDGYVTLGMNQGWYDNVVAWFICTDTNSIRFAMLDLTLAPKLSNTLVPNPDPTARPVYLATNFAPLVPVFSAAPGDMEYSGIWQVFFVTWKSGFARPITNAEPASMSNPHGIPDATEADVVETETVLDCSIVALHRLGGPFLPKPEPFYRIRQAITHSPRYKTITLPTWYAFAQDPTTRRVTVREVIIPDVSDQTLANLLGANLAPGLLNVPEASTPRMYVYDDPKPLTQVIVYPDTPTGIGVRNTNFEYDPIRRLTEVDRLSLPVSTTIQTELVQLSLQSMGIITIRADDHRVNAPMLPLERNHVNNQR